ncbi:MAG: hypothetical protein ACYC4R_02275 [Anaerolineae bacterium]
MHQPGRTVLLVTTFLLLAILPAAPPVVRAAGPTTFVGTLHYSENGPGAGVDGIATSFLVGGIGGGVAVARLRSILSVLDAAGALGDNPSMGQVSDMLNQSVPIDLAGLLPLSAHYDAQVRFVLEEQEDGAFALKEGTIRWNVSNSAEISGDGTSVVDQFSGSGQEALDPATDSITLTFDLSKRKPTYELTVNLEHPTPTSGESTWSAAGGAMVFHLQSQDGVQTMSGNVLGQEIPEEVTQSQPYDRGIYYTHTGPLSELSYRETYRNLLDAQVLTEYEITDSCSATIVKPEEDKLTLPKCFACSLDAELEAETTPKAYADGLKWELPDFGGKAPQYDPEDQKGATMHVWYAGPAPEDNEAFGPYEIQVTFDDSKIPCDDPEPRKVRVFFPRDSYNNPDGSVPNWYYYWLQTAAAQGHAASIIYDAGCSDYGYYNGFGTPAEADVIYVCDIMASGNPSTNPLTGKVTEGIDLFAATIRHEWTHLENNKDWWADGGYVSRADADGNWLPDLRDADGDLVRDDREAAYGASPRTKDTLGLGFRDCEIPAYLQEDTWTNGTADKEDWADPGKQSGS